MADSLTTLAAAKLSTRSRRHHQRRPLLVAGALDVLCQVPEPVLGDSHDQGSRGGVQPDMTIGRWLAGLPSGPGVAALPRRVSLRAPLHGPSLRTGHQSSVELGPCVLHAPRPPRHELLDRECRCCSRPAARSRRRKPTGGDPPTCALPVFPGPPHASRPPRCAGPPGTARCATPRPHKPRPAPTRRRPRPHSPSRSGQAAPEFVHPYSDHITTHASPRRHPAGTWADAVRISSVTAGARSARATVASKPLVGSAATSAATSTCPSA